MDLNRPASKQPIPEHATLAFKGVLFDVYQWEQELYDGTTATFEKLKRPDTVVVFPVLPDGRILLTRQEQPGKALFIGAAGGRVDPGEDIETAARRELLEETGYEADELLLWQAEQPTTKLEWAVYVFIAKGLRKAAEMDLDGGEKIELMPVTFDEFLEVGSSETFSEREIVYKLLEAKYDPAKKEALNELFR